MLSCLSLLLRLLPSLCSPFLSHLLYLISSCRSYHFLSSAVPPPLMSFILVVFSINFLPFLCFCIAPSSYLTSFASSVLHAVLAIPFLLYFPLFLYHLICFCLPCISYNIHSPGVLPLPILTDPLLFLIEFLFFPCASSFSYTVLPLSLFLLLFPISFSYIPISPSPDSPYSSLLLSLSTALHFSSTNFISVKLFFSSANTYNTLPSFLMKFFTFLLLHLFSDANFISKCFLSSQCCSFFFLLFFFLSSSWRSSFLLRFSQVTYFRSS